MGKVTSNVPRVMDGEVKAIAIDHLIPYSGHKFTLYQGERLDDMVESIKKNGVIVPVIVRTIEGSDKYEILSGHNRVYASGLAGLEKVPAVIKVGLSDEDSQTYAIISNVIQRGFRDLKISEQAYAVSMRYKKLFDEKKIAEINLELKTLENGAYNGYPVGTEKKDRSGYPLGTEDNYKNPRIREISAEEYGIGATTVVRLLRVNELNDELKELVDTKNISIRAAVEISYLSAECQQMLYECMSRMGITALNVNTAWELKELSKSVKDITPDMIERILNGSSALSVKLNRKNRITLDQEVFDKYFRNVPKKEVLGIVEKALEMYFNGARA